MLNGVVIMILCTCIISSLLTDWSSRMIVLRDKELPEAEDEKSANDEKILIPVRYPEYADKPDEPRLLGEKPEAEPRFGLSQCGV